MRLQGLRFRCKEKTETQKQQKAQWRRQRACPQIWLENVAGVATVDRRNCRCLIWRKKGECGHFGSRENDCASEKSICSDAWDPVKAEGSVTWYQTGRDEVGATGKKRMKENNYVHSWRTEAGQDQSFAKLVEEWDNFEAIRV